MHAITYFILSFIGAAHCLPAFLAENHKRSLINLSPDIDLGLDASHDNSCLGIGISVCDPITVDSTKNSTVTNDNSKAKDESDDDDMDSSGGDSLINISPDLDLDIDLSSDNSCLGIGISACDPITVGSDVTNTVVNDNSEKVPAKEEASTTTTSYPTYPTEAPSSEKKGDSQSKSKSNSGDSLLNLSPAVAPDVDLSGDNSCVGVGISACDPITVNSTIVNTVKNISR
ncbi:hypothetical protein GGR54DRAFT_598809 [Hypoxylon sp. NC1633]|nr:hypothetical protein GGR54DRAFT_598809 [Hypoxylon sp. NC1633]